VIPHSPQRKPKESSQPNLNPINGALVNRKRLTNIIIFFFVDFNISEKTKNWSSIGKLIFCPNCKAKIRPNKEKVGEIDIKCPSCKYEFQWLIKEYK